MRCTAFWEQVPVDYVAHHGPELRVKIYSIWEFSKTIAAWEPQTSSLQDFLCLRAH